MKERPYKRIEICYRCGNSFTWGMEDFKKLANPDNLQLMCFNCYSHENYKIEWEQYRKEEE